MQRRTLFRRTLAGALSFGLGRPAESARHHEPSPTILLRSGWQTVNIGDIAHTPGVLAAIEEHLPDARVLLWSRALDRGVEPMLRQSFPALRIVRDDSGVEPRENDPTLAEAFREADFCLHGSGPSVVAASDLIRWSEETSKPFGIFGVTLSSINEQDRGLLQKAEFVFTRETTSLKLLAEAGLKKATIDFVPDGTFAFDLRNEERAEQTLTQLGLQSGGFLCAIPRLRYTPYWEIRPGSVRPELIAERKRVNEQFAEQDHSKLREAIVRWVRGTGMKVLVCPEMTYQVELLRPLLIDPLPIDVQESVKSLDRYWLPDEAASIYARAGVVVSFECHSPILALTRGTPSLHLAQPTDTHKSQMYRDLGRSDWLLPIDMTTGPEIADRCLEIHTRPEEARAKTEACRNLAQRRLRYGARVLGSFLPHGNENK